MFTLVFWGHLCEPAAQQCKSPVLLPLWTSITFLSRVNHCIRADLCHNFFPSLFLLMRTILFHFCFAPCVSTHLRELSQGHMMCCTNGCWLQPGSKPHCCHSSMSRISASCLLCPPGMFPVAVV